MCRHRNWLLGSDVLLLSTGLSILTAFQPIIDVLVLALFFLPVTVIMHAFCEASYSMLTVSHDGE
jgi:hypothetical protein